MLPSSCPSNAAPDDGSIKIQSMSGGFTQIVYVTSFGSVFALGCNTRGQLGNGTIGKSEWSSVPLHVSLPVPIKQAGSGTAWCWALSADGRTAYTWGDNTKGQLGIGDPDVKYSDVPVQVDFHLPAGVCIVSMACGLWCCLALLSNGKVMAWGDNNFGQCGLDPKTAGTYIYKPTIVPGLNDVTQLASGDFYSMALEQNGTVRAWGQNTEGQLGPNGPTPEHHAHSYQPVQVTGLPPISKIVAGGKNGIALDTNGNIWEWGRDTFGELGRGHVKGTDKPHPTPERVTGIPPVVSVASQGPTVLAADNSGNVYAWGFNKWGAVGDGNTTNTGTPQLVLTLPDLPDNSGPSLQLAAAHRSSYAYNAVTGETFAWGENNYGQIGILANDTPNPNPVNISSEIQPTLPQPATPTQSTAAAHPGSVGASSAPFIGASDASPCMDLGWGKFAAGDWHDIPSTELLPSVVAASNLPDHLHPAAGRLGYADDVLATLGLTSPAGYPGWNSLAPTGA